MNIKPKSPEYLTIQRNYEILISTVKSQPGVICDALFAGGYIPVAVRDLVRSRSVLEEEKARKLIDTVIDRIEYDPSVYVEFVKILTTPYTDHVIETLQKTYDNECKQYISINLREPNSLDSHNSQLFNTPTSPTTPEPPFLCPYCKKCSVDKFFSKEGCPKRTSSIESNALFPYIDVSGLDEEDVIDLEDRLISDTTEIISKFADFSILTRESLESQNIPLQKIKDLILSFDTFVEEIGVNILDIVDKERIQAATCISGVFSILRIYNYISFFNYHILELLIKYHGIAEDHKRLKDYLDALHTFCERNVFEVPPSVFPGKSRKSAKMFALKCTEKICTLNNVEMLKRRVAKIFGLRSYCLQLCSIKKGCVELYFLIPATVAEIIFPINSSQHSSLSEMDVKFLGCESTGELDISDKAKKSELQQSFDKGVDRNIAPSSDFINNSSRLLGRPSGTEKKLSQVLIIACWNGSLSNAVSLVQQGANVDCSEYGTSPLIVACWGGHFSTAQFLINNGASVTQTDMNGRSPLLAACKRGHLRTAQLLISNGANLNQSDKFGSSPLIAACIEGHIDTVQMLIDKGADVNQCHLLGSSPLQIAMSKNKLNIAKLLLDNGAHSVSSLYPTPSSKAEQQLSKEYSQRIIQEPPCASKSANPLSRWSSMRQSLSGYGSTLTLQSTGSFSSGYSSGLSTLSMSETASSRSSSSLVLKFPGISLQEIVSSSLHLRQESVGSISSLEFPSEADKQLPGINLSETTPAHTQMNQQQDPVQKH